VFVPSDDAALRTLLRRSSLFEGETTADSHVSDRVLLPVGQSEVELLEGDALHDVRDVPGRLLTGEEFEGVLDSEYPSTRRDPALKHSCNKYLRFSRDLRAWRWSMGFSLRTRENASRS
jgi:hypothetical protein